jgi:4a-hydroxytetrahydrobiopterin dehydratase
MARHQSTGDFRRGAVAACGNQKNARPVAERLSDIGIQRELGGLPGWSRRGDSLTKTYRFPSFPASITFVTRVADVAESMDHHPDIDIRHTRLTFTLSSHDVGGTESGI